GGRSRTGCCRPHGYRREPPPVPSRGSPGASLAAPGGTTRRPAPPRRGRPPGGTPQPAACGARWVSASLEAVADPTYSADQPGAGGVVLDLCPQALDRNVDQARVAQVVVAPHPLKEHLAREHLSRPSSHLQQESGLRCG